MKIMVTVATILSVIPIFIALFMPNWYLGDKQNAVENVNLAGEIIEEEEDEVPAAPVRK